MRGRETYQSEADYERDREARLAINTTATLVERDARTAAANAERADAEIWSTQIDAERDKYPDFEAVAYDPSVPYSEVMINAVQGHPNGVDIAYYLGQNKETARRIASLPPLQAVLELGELGTRFKTAKSVTPPAKRQTNAPAPIKTVSGNGTGAGISKSPDDMDYGRIPGLSGHVVRNKTGIIRLKHAIGGLRATSISSIKQVLFQG